LRRIESEFLYKKKRLLVLLETKKLSTILSDVVNIVLM